MAKKKKQNYSGKERRKVERRPILESFSFFTVVPKTGIHRLPILDLSEEGVGFSIDIEGEGLADFTVKEGETFEFQLYMNQSLYLPLKIKIVRIVCEGENRLIGAEFVERQSEQYKALKTFVDFMDALIAAGVPKKL